VAAASLFALSERDGHVLFGVFMLFCCFEVAAFLIVLVSCLFNTLHPWAILSGNLVAALVMLGILFRDHHFSLHQALTAGD
jgi:CBS-domain-containing membrane protein